MSRLLSEMIQELINFRQIPIPDDNGSKVSHLRAMTELEDAIVVALNHIGPVIYNGRLWASFLVPRDSPIFSISYYAADSIWWPPPDTEKKEIKFPTESPG